MSSASFTAALGYVVAYGLVLHAIIRAVDHLDQMVVCRPCVALAGVEGLSGAVIFLGILVLTGGFLE